MTRRDRDFFLLSLNIGTRPRHYFVLASMSRQDRDLFHLSLNVQTRPRLSAPKSQCLDETKTILESQYFRQELLKEILALQLDSCIIIRHV